MSPNKEISSSGASRHSWQKLELILFHRCLCGEDKTSSSVCVACTRGGCLHAASCNSPCLQTADTGLAIVLLPIKFAWGETGRQREGEKVQRLSGFLSVGGRDLVLDLTDLLFQAEAPLLCGILIPYYITFHLAIRQTTATPPPSDQVSCCGHVRQTAHMNIQTCNMSPLWVHIQKHTFCTLSLVLLLLLLLLLLCRGF